MKIELSKEELEMIIKGLSAQISDYCVDDEDIPYKNLQMRLEDALFGGIII